jgi:hypothetical protein
MDTFNVLDVVVNQLTWSRRAELHDSVSVFHAAFADIAELRPKPLDDDTGVGDATTSQLRYLTTSRIIATFRVTSLVRGAAGGALRAQRGVAS